MQVFAFGGKKMDMQKLAEAVAAGDTSPARKLLTELFDADTFVEIDRLAKDGGEPVAAVAGFGMVDGAPVYAFAQDHDVCCGAIGKAQAAKIAKVYALAAQNGAPVVGIFDSDGARLGEGVDAMDAIAELLAAGNNLSGVVPQIAVAAGACVGSAAMIAAAADLVVAVDGADYYLSADEEPGQPDVTAADASAALERVRALLACLPANNLTAPMTYEYDGAAGATAETAADAAVMLADADSLITLSKQTAFARIGGSVCGVVTLAGDKLCSCACDRAARFVRLCDSFSIPVVTVVDAAGFASLKAATRLSQAYAEATVPKLSVVAGRAYGPVYIALAGKSAGADVVLAWPDAVISPLSPEAAIHLFWKDRLTGMKNPTEERAALAKEYAATACSPLDAAAAGTVTDVTAPADTKARLIAYLDMLAGKRVSHMPRKHTNIQL